jgi:hypothetical protein
VLEAGGDKGGDRQEDGGDLVDGAAGAVGQPDGQADQGVAQDPQRHRLYKSVTDLGVRRRQRRRPDRPAAEGVLARQEHQHGRAQGAGEVAGVNDPQLRSNPAVDTLRPAMLTIGCCRNNSAPPTSPTPDRGETTGDQPDDAAGRCPAAARWCEHTAERDEGASQHG